VKEPLPGKNSTQEAGTGPLTQPPAPGTQNQVLAYAVEYAFPICFLTAAWAAASRAMGTR
jgi:hypothetical protein